MMLFAIAAFELKYQLRSPAFWVCLVLFFFLAFGAVSAPSLHIVAPGNAFRNGSLATVNLTAVMTVFYMFAVMSIGSDVIVRDRTTGFGPFMTQGMSSGQITCSVASSGLF